MRRWEHSLSLGDSMKAMQRPTFPVRVHMASQVSSYFWSAGRGGWVRRACNFGALRTPTGGGKIST